MESQSPLFNVKNFESRWNALENAEMAYLVDKAAEMNPHVGILPVIKGVLSFQFNIRNAAHKSLGILLNRIEKYLENPDEKENYQRGLKQAALVSGRLYQHMAPEMSFNEISFFMKSLLGLGEHGAYFVFKALFCGKVSEVNLKKFIHTVPEAHRLAFVDQYLMASPEVRLKYVRIFRPILSQLKDRDAVISFYALLFDLDRHADPFLGNIPEDLRNPYEILRTEIPSLSPRVKIKGLKALAMVTERISTKLLKGILAREDVKKVRVAVYKIVENSSLGHYSDLFDAIFDRMKTADTAEGLLAFKALVVCGREPVHKVMDRVKDACPDLLPGIHMEVAELSRVAFFVVQDMAMNKAAYQRDHFDLNLACVLGMFQKRPERVVRIMKAYDARSTEALDMDVDGFVQKTRRLFSKERESIEDQVESVKTMVASRVVKAPKVLDSFLSTASGKNVDRLKGRQAAVDFQDQLVEGVDFTRFTMSAKAYYFSGTVFKDCNMAGLHLKNAWFCHCVFSNVDFSGAMLDGANFDRAVFLDVQAPKASFRECSFQEAKIYNSNFPEADFHDADLVNSWISKCIFTDANLSCAAFSHSLISGVSFVTSGLDQANFSYASSRFSQYPPFSRIQMRSRGLSYNARRYRLGFSDLPRVDKALIPEINLMLFSEFIHFGENQFLEQNKMSMLMAFDIFRATQVDFFQVIPLLLHENIPFPGSKLGAKTPCGIAQYHPTDRVRRLLARVMEKRTYTVEPSRFPKIEGLYTMGSVGSLAQTHESDVDYWVCVNENHLTDHEMLLLNRKLQSLTAFAAEKFKLSITFFVVDVLKARNNDFGDSNQESSGSAQSRLLKEEFYRTMIHVAGKLPLWAVIPSMLSLHYYNTIKRQVERVVHSQRYMDLGDIHAIPVNEYLGASIWQMFKWLKSPFKSVIKMGLLEKYIHGYGKEPLLCNLYKDRWMNSGSYMRQSENDSYIILLNHLMQYYESVGDKQAIGLLLTCFFLKLGIAKERAADLTVFGLRKVMLEGCLQQWNWNMEKVVELGRFREWQYDSIQRLSNSIERHMLAKYNAVKASFERNSQDLMISNEDRQALERKVNTMFLEKPCKIRRILLVSRSEHLFNRLHLKFDADASGRGMWVLFHKNKIQTSSGEEPLLRASTIEEIGAWLIHNSLYTSQSVISLLPNPTLVTHDDIIKLFNAMLAFFYPVIHKTVPFKALRKAPPEVDCLFINVNFYHQRQGDRVSDYCAVYVNSWGEMFYHLPKPGLGFSNLEAAKQDILKGIGITAFPDNTCFYFSKGVPR